MGLLLVQQSRSEPGMSSHMHVQFPMLTWIHKDKHIDGISILTHLRHMWAQKDPQVNHQKRVRVCKASKSSPAA